MGKTQNFWHGSWGFGFMISRLHANVHMMPKCEFSSSVTTTDK